MRKNKKSPKDTLGWREWVSLPDLGVASIKAKVDTGARTSALHAFELTTFTEKGELWVDFALHPVQRNEKSVLRCRAPTLGQRYVKDSGGHMEKRYFIETNLRVGNNTYPIEVTLTSRDNMGFRMLLGRTALKDWFIVDPARSYLSNSRNKRKKRKKVAKTEK